MNPASKSSLPTALDPVAAAMVAQLQETIEEQNRQIARNQQTIASYQMHVQKLEEALRLERIKKYGKQSEKLSDLQLELLDGEPAVSSEEIESEAAGGPLPEAGQEKAAEQTPQRKRKPHPGRNQLPAHLERVEEIVSCAAEHCKCGKCGAETRVIGYE